MRAARARRAPRDLLRVGCSTVDGEDGEGAGGDGVEDLCNLMRKIFIRVCLNNVNIWSSSVPASHYCSVEFAGRIYRVWISCCTQRCVV